MAIRIEIAYKENVRDVPAEKLKKRIELDLGKRVDAHVVDVYTVDSCSKKVRRYIICTFMFQTHMFAGEFVLESKSRNP